MTPQEKFDHVINYLEFLSDDVWTDIGATCRVDITGYEDKSYRYVKMTMSKIKSIDEILQVCKKQPKRVFKSLENSNQSLLLNLLCVSGVIEYDNMGDWYKEAYEKQPTNFLNPEIIKEFL